MAMLRDGHDAVRQQSLRCDATVMRLYREMSRCAASMPVSSSAAVDQMLEHPSAAFAQPSSSTDGMINYHVSVCSHVSVAAVHTSIGSLTQPLCLPMG